MTVAAELIQKMREGIAQLLREAEERTSTSLDALHMRVLRGEAAVDAPHPDPRWRFRSRKVFERLREEHVVWSLPWHHAETWLWAASCEAGLEWVESEVRYWEKRADAFVRFKERAEKKRRDLPELEYVYREGDEFFF